MRAWGPPVDVLGSVAGIATFAGLSLLGAPPVVWGVVIALAFVLLLRPRLTLFHVAVLVALVAAFGKTLFDPSVSWSPYCRIDVTRVRRRGCS